jgi:hypothetical protein
MQKYGQVEASSDLGPAGGSGPLVAKDTRPWGHMELFAHGR